MFRTVPAGPPDPVFILKNAADADLSNEKIDLGVGVYRNEEGNFHELEVIKKVSGPSPFLFTINEDYTVPDKLHRQRRYYLGKTWVTM